MLFAILISVPNSVTSNRLPPEPASTFQADVPTWYVGDTWTYNTHLQLRMDRNRTDLYGSSTFTVTRQFSVTQNGTYHEAYNVSISGSYTGTGSAYISGVALGISIDSAMLRGFQWIDRSDLSLIRDNESLQAAGNVTYLIFRYPLSLRFATESNRSPSQEDYDFPLLPGDTWSFAGNMRSIGFYFFSVTGTPFGDMVSLSPFDHNTTMDFDGIIKDVGNLNVGGRTYYSYHIAETPPTGSTRLGDSDLWYSPVVKNNVRWYLTSSTVDFVVGAFINLTAYTLHPDPFGVTMDLNSQIVNPGGFLNVTGTTGPSYSVWIRTPWNLNGWTTTSDGGGNYRFTIQAPANDDNTPCNADVGSHGVLVEAVNPADIVAYNASTIVLIVPDLAVSTSDMSFSSTPQSGVPTTVRAVVHASSNVGVNNPIEVEFLHNGSFLTTDTTMMMLPGSQHTFTATWIPTAGTHTIAVRVDPRDFIRETNESNNHAEIGAATSYPDLVPWNITISNGGSVHYDDPATTGFATPLLNGTWGEQFTISFGIMNRGNASHSGQVGLLIVETQGLMGPPIAPPIYDQILDLTIPPDSMVDAPSASWSVPPTHSTYFFNLTVDPDNLIAETFEANNTFAIRISVGAPDLTLGVIGPSKMPVGGTGTATINVRNAGDKLSPATTVEVRNVAGGSLLATLQVSAMNPSAIGSLSYPLDSLTSAMGTVCLQFDIDNPDLIVESDETNNRVQWCFDVMPLPQTSMTIGTPVHVGLSYTYITNDTDITFSAQDNSGTGIRRTQYSIDGGTWNDYVVGAPVRLSTEGVHEIRFNSTDNIGGADAPNTATVFVDDLTPVTTATWNGTAVIISATDEGSGLDKTYYRLDSGSFTIYQAPFMVTGDGSHTVWFYSVDNLGNVELQDSVSFTIGGGTSGTGAAEENVKPYVAVLFTVVLLAAFLMLRREDKSRKLLITAIVFIVVEIATGVFSLAFEPLSYVPSTGKSLGLYVDLVILMAGVAVLWVTHKSTAPKTDVQEPAGDGPEKKA